MLLLLSTVTGCSVRAGLPSTSTSETAKPQLGSVTSHGVAIHYQLFGDGPPLLIVNGGFGLDSGGFETLARPLSAHHQVVLFDRRGTGHSAMSELSADKMTMALMADDIEAIRRVLGHNEWSVLGHSFGGMLASYYTAQHPDQVRHLILSSSSGVDLALFETDARAFIHEQLSDDDRASLLALETAYEAGEQSEALLEQFSIILGRAYVVDDTLSGWVSERLRRTNHDVGALISADLMRISFDCRPALADFPRPVLVTHGEEDIFPLSISERAAATFPDAELVIVDGSGHYGWLDQPEAYRELILRFLAE